MVRRARLAQSWQAPCPVPHEAGRPPRTRQWTINAHVPIWTLAVLEPHAHSGLDCQRGKGPACGSGEAVSCRPVDLSSRTRRGFPKVRRAVRTLAKSEL